MSAFTRFWIHSWLLAAGLFGVGGVLDGLKPKVDENKSLEAKIAAKKSENDQLRTYIPKLARYGQSDRALFRSKSSWKRRLCLKKRMLTALSQVAGTITASGSGIEIRRTRRFRRSNHEFYGEVPFAIEY